VVTGLLVVVGPRAWHAGPAGRLLFFAVIPFRVFDDLVLTHDQGIVLSSIWLGIIDRYVAETRSRSLSEAASPPAPPNWSTSA